MKTYALIGALSLIAPTVQAQTQTLAKETVTASELSVASLDLVTPEFTVKLPATMQGKTAELFFISGREGSISLAGSSIKMRSVKDLHRGDPSRMSSSLRTTIRSDGRAVFESVTVPRSGFDVANYVVIVVHTNQGEHYLRNADGSCPTDTRLFVNDLNCASLPEASVAHESISFITLDRAMQNKDASNKATLDYSQLMR